MKRIRLFILFIILFNIFNHSIENVQTLSRSKNKDHSIRFGKEEILNPQTLVKVRKIRTSETKSLTKRKLEWKLVFDDEFNEGEEDLSKLWNILDEPQNFDKRKQYYSPSNIRLRQGKLEIVTRKQEYRNKFYTSGAMTTKNKFNFKYGKIEINALLPSGKGIFPAFWMLPSNGNKYPEIDIMEYLGQEPNQIWNVEHYLLDSRYTRQYTNIHKSFNFSNSYHTYGLEWEPNKVTWILDGKSTYSTTKYSPNTYMFLYLNTAVGGIWATDPNQSNVFPQIMKIDYVRIYKKMG